MRLGTNPTTGRRHAATAFGLMATNPGLILGLVYAQALGLLLVVLIAAAVVKLAWVVSRWAVVTAYRQASRMAALAWRKAA